MFSKPEKKKKRKGFALTVGALAMVGAYSVISGTKQFCISKCRAMMNFFGKMKNKTEKCATELKEKMCGDEEEPFD